MDKLLWIPFGLFIYFIVFSPLVALGFISNIILQKRYYKKSPHWLRLSIKLWYFVMPLSYLTIDVFEALNLTLLWYVLLIITHGAPAVALLALKNKKLRKKIIR